MSIVLELVEGWTGDLGPFTLKLDAVAVDLTGFTITLILRDAAGTLITTGGTVTIDADQVTNKGQLTYTPVAADFVFTAGAYKTSTIYQMHWKVVDGAGDIVFFPNDGASELAVFRA